MPGPFQTYAAGLDGALSIPTSFLNAQGSAYLQALGQTKDYQLDRILQGVKARFPTFSPSDALDLIGQERLIPRAQGEHDSTYSARLIGAWETWTQAGTVIGLLTALQIAQFPCTILQNRRAFSLDGSGNLVTVVLPVGGYHPSGVPAGYWSAFDLLIGPTTFPPGWPPAPLVTSPDASRLFSVAKLWKPAHALLAHVLIFQSGWFLGEPDLLVLGSTVPPLGVANITTWDAFF